MLNHLKKYWYFILIILLSCSNTKISYSQNLSAKDFYFPASEVKKFPRVFSRIEKFIEKIYTMPESSIVSDFFNSEEKIYEYAKLMVQLNFLSDEQINNYFDLADSKYNAYKKSKNKNSIDIPSTFQVVNMMRNYIYKKLPWEWKFHLSNKYILIVKVKELFRDTLTGGYPFYRCDVIDDIKGNYEGPKKDAIFAGNFDPEIMEPGKIYMILIFKRTTLGEKLLNNYMIRGLVTNHHGISPILNKKIIDRNNALHTGKERILIEDYKKKIRNFLYNIADVSRNE